MLVKQPYSSTSLYVGDLSPDVTENHLFNIFNAIGPVSSVRICRECGTSRSLGYAYVNYHLPADAERSIDTLNYTLIKGSPCRIMWSQRDPTLRRTGTGNVYVKNLDEVIDNKALHDTFSLFGNILSCKVATDEFGKSKGFGFVHFDSSEAAKKAIEKLNNVLIGSKVITVCPFLKQTERLTQTYTNLYVKQFPDTWTKKTLEDIFGQFGTIVSMIISTDSKDRKFALVNFATPESAVKAVENLHGRKVGPLGLADTLEVSNQDELEKETPDYFEKKTSNDNNEDSMNVGNNQTISEQVDDEVVISSDINLGDDKGSTITEKQEDAPREDEVKVVDTAKDSSANQSKEQEQQQLQQARPEEAFSKKTGLLPINEVPKDCLYVQRAMSKAERVARLKESYLASKGVNVKGKNLGTNLFIKNLHEDVTDEILAETFSKFGSVVSAKVMKTENNISRGFGFVSYFTPEEASKAVSEMHSVLYYNKPLYVGLAIPREHRVAQLQKYRTKNPNFYRINPHNMLPNQTPPSHQIPAPPQQPAPMVHTYPLQRVTGEIPANSNQPQIYNSRPLAYTAVPWRNRFEAATAAATLTPNPAAPGYGYRKVSNIPQRMVRANGQAAPNGPPLTRPPNQYSSSPPPPSVQQINHTAATHHQNFKFTAQARNRHDGGYMQPPPNVQPPQAVPTPQQQNIMFPDISPITTQPTTGAATHPQMQKQIIGERLFPLVHKLQPELAGKITGMMLEMDNTELLSLLDSETLLHSKVQEALNVLQRHQSTTAALSK